jgi:hypothetical protein
MMSFGAWPSPLSAPTVERAWAEPQRVQESGRPEERPAHGRRIASSECPLPRRDTRGLAVANKKPDCLSCGSPAIPM